jgi:hypothetical protein
MISIFTQQNPQDLATLQEAIEQVDWPLIYKTTHGIRNAVGFFGINHLIGNDLLAIEKMAKTSEQIEEIKLIFNKIKPVCQQAVHELKGLESAL